ncbi:MAG: sulfatase-like hydrolase/transferase [Planctomycetota bacterium]
MNGFRNTLLWVCGVALAVYSLLTLGGYFYIASHENHHAQALFDYHFSVIVSVYGRVLIGYLLAGALAAFVLHPFVRGWKAGLAALGLLLLGFIFTLTNETHLLYGPTQTLYCTVHDAIPASIRALYSPVLIQLFVLGLSLAALYRWTKPVAWTKKGAVLGVTLLGWAALSIPRAKAAPAQRPSFVLIATDSLRADRLSCNGYARPTTPHIDKLAARGTNFTQCLVPTASTHESWVTLFSSREPREHGLRHMFPSREKVAQVEKDNVFLPRHLREHGYHTAAIGGWCGTTFDLFDTGFEHVDVSRPQNHRGLLCEAAFTNHLVAASFLDNPVGRLLLPELERTSFTRGSSALTGKAKRWLEKASADERPFFLTIVYHVTHLPYSASHPYYQHYTDPDYRGRNRYRIDFKIDDMIQRGFDHDLSPEEMQHIVDLYDGCVTEFDDQVGAIMAKLEELGLAENTIVGVWSDHGDDLYEHGTTLGHGVTLFGGDQSNHVPAVFAGPGIPRRRENKLVRSQDLAPTFLQWLGVPDRPESWSGVDLSGEVPELSALLETSYLLYRQPVPDLRPGEVVKKFPTFDRATFLDPEFDFNFVLRDEFEQALVDTKCFAVREGRWKLIRVPGEKGPIDRLFDLAEDPQCRRDLVAEHPDVYRKLAEKLPR